MATYYIATTGNDTTGDGSSSNPWLTLQHFLDNSADNDTLIVKDGTYTLTANVAISQRTIQAENNGLAIFDGGNTQISFILGGTNLFTGLIFQRFYAITASRGGIFNATQSEGATTWNNCTFKENRVAYTSSFARGAIFCSENNLYTFNLNTCLLHSNYASASSATASGLFSVLATKTPGIDVNIVNTTIVQNITDGTEIQNIFFNQGNDPYINVDIKNTIVYNAHTTSFNLVFNTDTITNFTTSYSDYYSVSDPNSPTIISGTGVITADPIFIDPANNNYNLSPSSPCIDAGTLI